MDRATARSRVFKTAWFSKAVRKAHIEDDELCVAIQQVMLGKADDLGGGVFKKRLGKNLYRSIVVARGREGWVFEYLFAKRDRANIEGSELAKFRSLAKEYQGLSADQIDQLVANGAWVEICDGE
jgi:hypothetical protein